MYDNHLFYRGGNKTIVEGKDPNKWSFFEVVSLVKELGYDGFRLLRKISGLDEGFTHLTDDV